MMIRSGRRFALPLATTCAILGGSFWATDASADDPIPTSRNVVVTKPLVVDDDIPPLLPVRQIESNPTPPPPLTTEKKTTAAPPKNSEAQSLVPVPQSNEPMAPLPLDGGMVGPGPVSMGPGPGDQFPVFYRDRPKGNAASKAAIISHNRGNEPGWYKHWRCEHYGYYPTQWRPWPDGWHQARNLPPSPFPHPYDLKQPEPNWPDDEKPELPRARRTRDQSQSGSRDGAKTPSQKRDSGTRTPPALEAPPGKRGT
jgi:hypothetical protein